MRECEGFGRLWCLMEVPEEEWDFSPTPTGVLNGGVKLSNVKFSSHSILFGAIISLVTESRRTKALILPAQSTLQNSPLSTTTQPTSQLLLIEDL